MEVRNVVNKELEEVRNAGKIGAPLEAEVTLYCAPELYKALTRLETELRFILITSAAHLILDEPQHVGAEIKDTALEGLRIKITPSEYTKCERCWQRRDDVGTDDAHPLLCARCVENIDGEGEVRRFA